MTVPADLLDLNSLREIIIDNQSKSTEIPDRDSKQVFVDREGHIVLTSPKTPAAGHELSVVHQGVFA